MTRVLRLEHDPRPELWRPHTRPWFLRLLTVGWRYTAGIRMSLKGVGRPRRRLGVTRERPLAGRYVSVSLAETGLQAVAGCPNAANPDSQPSAALTYGGCGGIGKPSLFGPCRAARDRSRATLCAGCFRNGMSDRRDRRVALRGRHRGRLGEIGRHQDRRAAGRPEHADIVVAAVRPDPGLVADAPAGGEAGAQARVAGLVGGEPRGELCARGAERASPIKSARRFAVIAAGDWCRADRRVWPRSAPARSGRAASPHRRASARTP